MNRNNNKISYRELRVGQQIRFEITQLFQRGKIKNIFISNSIFSISEVKMSSDLKEAKCFVISIGKNNSNKISNILNFYSKNIRFLLSNNIYYLKYMPNLRFFPDNSFDNLQKIDKILQSPNVTKDLIK